jgi:RNA polymerase sigma-70 factor (ECF subfamily)
MTAAAHDEALRAAAAGDDRALEALVREYHDRVYRFGVRVCRDAFDADDAVQEAFAKLARRPDVVVDRGALAWLLTVVKNACLRLARTVVRDRLRLGERIDDADAVPSSELDPELALERWRLVELVHRAIAALEKPYREVIVLRDLEGLSGEQVAASLALSEPAMKSRLHRARQQIRAFIEAERGR